MRRGVVLLLLATPAIAWAGLAPAIVVGLEAFASVTLQMTVLVIAVIGNLWAFAHIRRAVTGGRHGNRRH